MANPSEKLAESLQLLKDIQAQGIVAIQSKQLSRIHRERLIKNGFLKETIKGWYIPSRPDEPKGESTAWYASFWPFCSSYLDSRFKKNWCLSPEQSLFIYAENWTVPRQLLVHTAKGNNKITPLLHNTSLFDARYNMPNLQKIVVKHGLRIFSLTSALIHASPKFFIQHPNDARTVLSMVTEPSELLHALLEGSHSTVAGRLCGAFRNVGHERIANDIKKTMIAAGFDVREHDPFVTESVFRFKAHQPSPSVNRMIIMWHEMRNTVMNHFPKPLKTTKNVEQYLENVEAHYVNDAYHSLSIEGYQVSRDLVEKVRSGNWNPDSISYDQNQKNALAARGYWQSFNAVKKSIRKVLKGGNSGKVIEHDHGDWYRELFQPSVLAGILKPTDLAGYRTSPVYIRGSMHVPPRYDVVRELMPSFFKLLREEKEASVRVVLGHFFFVYIHPYMDGNGRIGRFLMNVMMASGNYPWTIVPLERRNEYMSALEEASVNQNIAPFCKFLASCLDPNIGWGTRIRT